MSKPFYVTTAIAYINAKPHIGFAMEVIIADALARYHTLIGDDTYYLTGSDEHGIKQKRTAEAEGLTPQELCDRNVIKFQELTQLLNLTNDDYMRTSDQKRHWPTAQTIWKKLVDNGDIYKDQYSGLYCAGCENYVLEKDLVDGNCPNHNAAPEEIVEENYFFKLSKYSEQIQELIESKELEIIPHFRSKEILNVVKEGLHDVSFSRPKSSLNWGVPVPDDDTQVMYVWCDALTNYLSGVDYVNNSEQYQKYWPEVTHVIGKDIVRFHAALWPAMLLAAGVKPPKQIVIHGFITSEGQKMSKSLGNVIDPEDLVNEFGTDALRYYLLSEIPIGKDGDFSMDLFKERYNSNLANNLGNMINRVLLMSKKYEVELNMSQLLDDEAKEKVQTTWTSYQEKMNNGLLHEGINIAWDLIHFANKYIDNHQPWKLIKEDEQKTKQILTNLLEICRHVSWLIMPFIPETATKIQKQLSINTDLNFADNKIWGGDVQWNQLGEAEILFPRIEDS
jgi:methionyl-tRNA synthetase